MEKIDKRQSFKQLIQGLNISNNDILSSLSNGLDNFVETVDYEETISIAEIEEILLRISVECYNFLKLQTNFDSEELLFFEKVLQKVDDIAKSQDKDSLEKIFYFLVEKGLPYRAELFYKKIEEKEINDNLETETWRLA
jgi:hypothetical protein